MKNTILVLIALILVSTFVIAHGEDTFAEAEEIIEQKISCDDLTENQLEILGDYYMEQMHPGELHEIMDERMGGEGSESLRQAHINMGLSFYCGEHEYTSTSFMDNMMGRGMMGYYPYSQTNPFMWIFNIILIAGIVLLIIWLSKQISKKEKHRKK